MSDLYDTDFLRWTEHQVDLLRRKAAGEAVNDATPSRSLAPREHVVRPHP
jgi:hypothetical protein